MAAYTSVSLMAGDGLADLQVAELTKLLPVVIFSCLMSAKLVDRSSRSIQMSTLHIINPIKTKSMTIATRQKHQLSPLPLDLVLRGANIDQVSKHRLLGIIIDKKNFAGTRILIIKQPRGESSVCRN